MWARRRSVVTMLIAALLALLGAGAADGTLQHFSISAFHTAGTAKVSNPSDNANLAEAVRRWDAESPATGPGEPMLDNAKDLISGAGTEGDTLSAFPTDRGRVCYQV